MKTYAHFMFSTYDIPGGSAAILDPSGCRKDVAKVDSGGGVYLDLEENDERIPKVLALLHAAGKKPLISYGEEYTEEEIQCPTCSRGRKSEDMTTRTPRVTYRREDLKNVCDFNLSWEAFGRFWDYGKVTDGWMDSRRPLPWIFITPKVMNILRGKTKREQNNQGCRFTPIWIEEENGRVVLETGGK